MNAAAFPRSRKVPMSVQYSTVQYSREEKSRAEQSRADTKIAKVIVLCPAEGMTMTEGGGNQ